MSVSFEDNLYAIAHLWVTNNFKNMHDLNVQYLHHYYKMSVDIYTKCKQLDYINTVKITRFSSIYTTYCK